MKSIAAAFAAVAFASTPSLAADLFEPAPPPVVFPGEGPLTEVGTNWYLRGDVGVDFDSAPKLSFAAVSTPTAGVGVLPIDNHVGSAGTREDFTWDVGIGYRFNNWLRGEVTYDYRAGPGGGNSNTVICPYGLTPVGVSGYLYDTTNTCNGNLNLQQHNQMGLASAYLDLGHYWGFTPYVGAGAGVNANSTSGNVAYTTTTGGTPYGASLATGGAIPQVWVNAGGTPISPQPGVTFAQQNWNRSFHSTKYSFAWALMAGVGIQLSPSATLDIGYRYVNAGTNTTSVTPEIGSSVKQTNSSQEIRVGIRYMAN